ncbi:phosphoribosylamine--glycine ligase [Atopococcus tabaci]|uniref:phosphoribosylamine--glycine ligase n=1 Tax=Atopococcus tabaci TaxID=269774 RepID=UPI002409DF7A|nr:phosphoribosylamine--glycine ligase [Atopococcus tabaci]
MKILIIGAGGREHALARAFEKSKKTSRVFVAPGNPGMELEAEKISCVPIAATDKEGLVEFAKENGITYTVVGPELTIEAGVVDAFMEHGLAVVGPTKTAGQIETSKVFAKTLMAEAGIPTARFEVFTPHQLAEAKTYVDTLALPVVIKENGLAAGKGVYICEDRATAYDVLQEMMEEKQVDIVVEEFLVGAEFSHFSLVNEEHIIPLGIAKDYKRAFDGSKGPNTGGMGAVSPVTPEDEAIGEDIMNQVVRPLVEKMNQRGTPYTGILYTGVMMTVSGIKVIEFNARFGDPETQVLLPMIENDWIDILENHFDKRPLQLNYTKKQSLGVIVAAKGYPGTHEKGFPLPVPPCTEETTIHYSGVSSQDGQLTAAGGRLFMISSQAETIAQCRENVYAWLEQLDSTHVFYRRDIGRMDTLIAERK